MPREITAPPRRVISNPSERLTTKMQKAGITKNQLEAYLETYFKNIPVNQGRRSKNNKNDKNARKQEKLSLEVLKEVDNPNLPTRIDYV